MLLREFVVLRGYTVLTVEVGGTKERREVFRVHSSESTLVVMQVHSVDVEGNFTEAEFVVDIETDTGNKCVGWSSKGQGMQYGGMAILMAGGP